MGAAHRKRQVGEGSETPRTRKAKALNSWLARLPLGLFFLLGLDSHEDSGESVEVLELGTFGFWYRNLRAWSHMLLSS